MKVSRKRLEKLCKMTQPELKKAVKNELSQYYDDVIESRGFVFAKGEIPICLVAHLDTVHDKIPEKIVYDDKGNMSSPQGIGGDDRCGVYAILELIKKHKCSVLFCEDEECGGHGAKAFVKHPVSSDLDFNYMIELDRRGFNDAVFYSCDNPEFEEFITKSKDWRTSWGSFSDISIVAPELGCAAVNLSCGYYRAHTKEEYINLYDLASSIQRVCKLIEKTTENDKFEYIEETFASKWDYYYDYGMSSKSSTTAYEGDGLYGVFYVDQYGAEEATEVYAGSMYEAIGIFLTENPELCYNDVEDVLYFGEDVYAM